MPVQSKTKQEVLGEFRKSQILEASRKVFAEKGFRDATMDQIAEESGIAKGTLYLYFPSKQDVYLEALTLDIAELSEQTQRNMALATGTEGKVRAFIGTRMAYLEQHRNFFQIYHSEFGNIMHPAGFGCRFREIYEVQLEALRKVFADGIAAGEVRPMPAKTLAAVVYQMTKGVIVSHLLSGEPIDVEEQTRVLTDLVWKGMAQ